MIHDLVTSSMTDSNQNNADDIDIGSDYNSFNAEHGRWCALKWFELTLDTKIFTFYSGNVLNVPVW